jgi:NADH-quinone oxidoreductase subunit G
MTVTAKSSAGPDPATPAPIPDVTMTIDGVEVSVPKGTLVIRAAELLGIEIPRFCDHPLLSPAGACRQCLVEAATPGPDGSLRQMPKPQASCTLECTPGMVVKTQHTSEVAARAQRGVMELLLINHPLDCPICDKGGECPLQNQAMTHGQDSTRFTETKRTYPKPISISTQVLLDRERCVLCQRCTRFSAEIAGDAFIDLQMRGAHQQIGTFSTEVLGYTGEAAVGEAAADETGRPFASYFSGNTVQICPVGALTGAAYRFRARPFDLVSTPSVCEHCASGCALRVDHRRGTVLRRLAGDDPVVNEEWNCDKGRWAFPWAAAADRLTAPLVRDEDTGELRPASWPEAISVAAAGLTRAREAGGVGVLTGGRVTVEDAYGYAKFARVALGGNDIDFRARPHSAEEADFLGAAVAGRGIGVTYADLERAPAVLLAGFEPEDESPIVFLRLRKAARRGLRVFSVAPWSTRGLDKLDGTLLPAAPGTEAGILTGIGAGTGDADATGAGAALRADGAVILVGERLAETAGALSAAVALAATTGARLAWVPRRAGERGAVEAGALPGLLPGGRPVSDPAARVDMAAAWDVESLPETPGRDCAEILAAAEAGDLGGLVIGGVDLADLPDPAQAGRALAAAGFVVSLEVRASTVSEQADVVLPVAPPVEKDGTFLDWEGRWRTFPAVLSTAALPDHRVLDMLGEALSAPLGLTSADRVRAEIAELGAWEGTRVSAPDLPAGSPAEPATGEAVLATWHQLLDAGRLQDGEPYLAGTARRAVARLSAATAAEAGVPDGGRVRVSTDAGGIDLPAVVTDLPDRVVWLPVNSAGSAVRGALGAVAGSVVRVSGVEVTGDDPAETAGDDPAGEAGER